MTCERRGKIEKQGETIYYFLYCSVSVSNRRGYLSVAAAAIYMASQASDFNKSQKGKD